MRDPVRVWLLAISCFCIGRGSLGGEELTQGSLSVEINELGVLVAVPGAPIATVDASRLVFDTTITEWFGIAFNDATGQRVYGVGSGVAPDWSTTRASVSLVSFTANSTSATSVACFGELELSTHLYFDGPHLIATVTLHNRGVVPLTGVFYSREWLAAPTEPSYWTVPNDLIGAGVAAPGVSRRIWMTDDLLPGVDRSLTFSYGLATPPAPLSVGIDVPLTLWTSPSFPTGLVFGDTNGISFGDYDADGWIDVFAAASGNLWRNLSGTSWQLTADFDPSLMTGIRYGSSFGDYNNDGRPDIGTEPRSFGDPCMHVFKSLGGVSYIDIAPNPALLDLQPCFADSETICWGDVDGDANLDCFLPVYPPWAFGPGNFFLYNLGATGPAGEYRFDESSAAVGLDNPPPASARPEGAQFLDTDRDGDIDLYSNGTLYQNRSEPTAPDFDAMTEPASGIGLSTSLDEGAVFFDYDLDGDEDLAIVYSGPGVRIWENYGDGKFFAAPPATVTSPLTGLDLGMSAADWDNDGDIDFTTRQVFRRNMYMETGQRLFTVASHTISPAFLTSATPAWGDWDKDGDLDSALGNWTSTGRLFRNTLYDGSEPLAERRFLRVRVLRDSVAVPAGLETEYGAMVELIVRGNSTGNRFRLFTSSSAGYLNQNEYTLHFALPADPAPSDPAVDLLVDIVVDFPGPPSQGFNRVDRFVNPALGHLAIATLTDREIVVFRSGRVILNGVEHVPPGYESVQLTTGAGGLRTSTASASLPAPVTVFPGSLTGIEFHTLGATVPVRIREIIIDGVFDSITVCDGREVNALLWDVTDPGEPFVVEGGHLALRHQEHNRRITFPANFFLMPERVFRLVARLSQNRATPIAGPLVYPNLTITGGLNFVGVPCNGLAAAAAIVDPASLYMTVRFAEVSFAASAFARGDCNQDRAFNITDPIYFLGVLFTGVAGPACDDACDANDDGLLNLADVIQLLETMFVGTGPLPPPYLKCGADPTVDGLTCQVHAACL
ncbi:MAG: FG-GAP repeat domain-containing protein [Planctomycetota bacterium]